LMEGEKMAVLCREFDISRKTGYKLFNRFKSSGIEGLTDRSRRPYRHANRLPFQIENLILQLKEKHSSWGAQKIRDKIKLLHSTIHLPAISTVHAVLDRHNLVSNGRKKRYKAEGTMLSHATRPNDSWCADYKGEFMLADQRYCYPLTITDFSSRYLLCCEISGRGDRIRTCDIYVPNVALYQSELHPGVLGITRRASVRGCPASRQ
jgi:putative transposase